MWPSNIITPVAWQLVALAGVGAVYLIVSCGPVRRLARRGRHYAR